MNTIYLPGGYRIDIDHYSHTLIKEYKGKKKNGEEYDAEKTIGYYANLKQAIGQYLKENQYNQLFTGEFSRYVEMVESCNREATEKIIEKLNKLT